MSHGKAIRKRSKEIATRKSTLRNGISLTRTREVEMGLAAYDITGADKEWRVSHDGKAENVYETKEAAF
jgi:hypothetical protein